jgi:nucleoid-associated protein YgaU
LAAASAAQSNAASRTTLQTYRVKNGDTLSRIAAQVYQDPTQWPRIRDANRRVLGDSTTLKAGQLLVIP